MDGALRSILRQDPQVLMLGEIRDAATATLAVQAALSGHRLICTSSLADAEIAVAGCCGARQPSNTETWCTHETVQ